MLPKYRRLRLPGPTLEARGRLRSAYGVIRFHRFKPQKNITDGIFPAQILGHKLLSPNASF
jgi:hypothetical protein